MFVHPLPGATRATWSTRCAGVSFLGGRFPRMFCHQGKQTKTPAPRQTTPRPRSIRSPCCYNSPYVARCMLGKT